MNLSRGVLPLLQDKLWLNKVSILIYIILNHWYEQRKKYRVGYTHGGSYLRGNTWKTQYTSALCHSYQGNRLISNKDMGHQRFIQSISLGYIVHNNQLSLREVVKSALKASLLGGSIGTAVYVTHLYDENTFVNRKAFHYADTHKFGHG